MKQFLLFLSLAGAALYALLVFTHNAITDGKSGRIPLYQTQPDHPVPQRLKQPFSRKVTFGAAHQIRSQPLTFLHSKMLLPHWRLSQPFPPLPRLSGPR